MRLKSGLRALALGGALAAMLPGIGVAADITRAGATFPYPIYAKWADAYRKSTGVGLNYQSIGSGGGVKQITAKTVDFGASDGPMTDKELFAVDGKLLHIPTVLGAVVPTFNVPGVKGLTFDGKVLAGI